MFSGALTQKLFVSAQQESSTEGVRSARASKTSGKDLRVAIATVHRGNALVEWRDL